MMKKLSAVLIFLLMLSSVVFAAEVKDVNMELVLKGQDITYDPEVKPLVRGNRTFIPLRAVSEKCGFKVEWKEKTREVNLTKDDQSMDMTVGNKEYLLNGETKTMDVAPFIHENQTYLPLRFLSEALGLEVVWDDVNRVALVGFYGRDPELKQDQEEFILEGTGMAINLPKVAKDQIVINKTGRGYEFRDRMHVDQKNEWGGRIGEIVVEDRPSLFVPHGLLGYRDGKYISFLHVSDVNCDINNEALIKSYEKSDDMVWKIMESAHRVKEAR